MVGSVRNAGTTRLSVLVASERTSGKDQCTYIWCYVPTSLQVGRVTLPPLERVKYAQITFAITTRYYAVQISA